MRDVNGKTSKQKKTVNVFAVIGAWLYIALNSYFFASGLEYNIH